MLDHGFSSKHKYYYCGDKVSAEPIHIDDGLVRFQYSFPDGQKYTLNLCPIRKNYVRRLLEEAGFQRVRTYGDFQETYAEDDPDFFIHVAEKSTLHVVRWGGGTRQEGETDPRDVAEDYYDSQDADTFYSRLGRGGPACRLYDDTRDIRRPATRRWTAWPRSCPISAQHRGARHRRGLWGLDAPDRATSAATPSA